MEFSKALAGVKIADFAWLAAGPIASRILADFGATVVRIESSRKPEILRLAGPFKDDTPGLDRSSFFANYNTNKYSITIDLQHPKGAAIGLKLALWADIVTDSMKPGVMAKFGLDYDSLSKHKPDIIMFSSVQQGQTGPYRNYTGTGSLSTALAGLTNLVGWPDREPPGVYGAYTDFISPWLTIPAVLAALEYRQRTGKGQYIDQSQTEAGMFFGGLALLDYAANGNVWERKGNREFTAVPHGAYRCLGDDRWCVIAVTTDTEWQALCNLLQRQEWTTDPRFITFMDRHAHADELDQLIEKSTIVWDAYELMQALQTAGVRCGVIQKASDLFKDPQVAESGHFWFPQHPVLGRHAVLAPASKLSMTPAELQRPSPCLGEHNEYVLKEMLGLDDDEISEIVEEGILE